MMQIDKSITSRKIKIVGLNSLNETDLECLRKIKSRIQYVNAIIRQVKEPLSKGIYLIVSQNGIFQKSCLLDKEIIMLGRSKDSHIKLDSINVSRLHCILELNNMIWELKDMDSANGVFVNYARVQKRVLCDGDLITVGNFDMVYFISQP